jgi:cell division protein FtsW
MMAGRVTPITAAKSVRRAESAVTNDRTAVLLLLPIAMLLIIGLGALLSASSVVAIRADLDNLYYFKRQIIWTLAGVGALLIASRIPYRFYARWALAIFGIAVAGLVATLLFGTVRGGARRWLEIGSVPIQTSEFAKFAVIVVLATVMTKKEKHLGEFSHVFWPVVATLGIVGGLLLLQPDLGTAVLIAAAAFAVLTVSAAPLRHVIGLGTLGAGAAIALAFAAPYRARRVTSFLDSSADRLGDGFQAFQSLVALGTGGWFGVGLGASRARWSFLPNAHTDFIFAIIGEETGLAGSLAVIALFLAFSIVGTAVAMRAPDRFGRLLAIGIVAWISLQAIVNIGGVTRVLPITGVPLPFVSAGGSAMLANLFVVGVLLNIASSSRRGTEPAKDPA